MKSAFFKTLAVTALAVAAAVPAAAQFDVVFDIGSASGLTAAPPPTDSDTAVTVRINAVKTTANTRRVGDLQIRVFYSNTQINDAAAPTVTVPGIHTAYAAVISTASVDDTGPNLDGNAATNRYRTLLVSFNPNNAPLDFGAGVVGDTAPIVALTFQLLPAFAGGPLAFGTTADPSFPSGYRNSTPVPAPVYATNTPATAFAAQTTTYVSYNAGTDADGDGRANTPGIEDEFAFAPGTSDYMWDTDSDGISDGREIALGTNPNLTDTDADGVIDGVELRLRAAAAVDGAAALYNPLVANTLITDADADGLPASVDPDDTVDNTDFSFGSDQASDAYEYAVGTDPNDSASLATVGDLDNSGTVDAGDALLALDYSGFIIPIGSLSGARNGNISTDDGVTGDPFISSGDGLTVLDYSGFLLEQVR